MDKREFLKALELALQPIDKTEREQTLAYYEEIIDDRCDSGMTEKEAVYSLGSIEEITRPILEDAGIDADAVENNDKMSIWDAIKTLFVGFCIVCANIMVWLYDISIWISGIPVIVFGIPSVMTYTASYVGVGLCMCAGALALCVPLVKFTKWSYIQLKGYILKIKSFIEHLGGNK